MTSQPVAAPTLLSRRLALLTEGLPPTYWFLWLGMLINRAGSFVIPMMTIYLTQRRGLSLTQAGAVLSAFGLGALVGVAAGGVLADRVGRRFTMLTSLTLGAVSMITVGVADSLWTLTPAVFFLGLTGDAMRPALQAVVADVVDARWRMKAFSYLYWAINLGFSGAAVIGGLMATRNFTALFLGDALTTLVFAALVWRWVPETKPVRTNTEPVEGSLLTPFVDKKFLPLLVLSMGTALIFFQHIVVLPVDIKAKGLTSADVGFALSANGILIVLLQPAVTRWVGGARRGLVLAVATALVGLGFGLTPWASSLPAYVATVVVWTLGEILMAPVNSSLVADLSPLHLRGRYQAAYSLTWSVAMMLAPALSPWLVSATSLGTFWLMCLALGLVLSVGHLLFTSRTVSSHLTA